MPTLAADPRGVDEDERPVAALEDRVDRIARRAGQVGHDHALVAEDRVQQRRLADVRAAEDRDADRIVGSLHASGSRKLVDDHVEEVAAAVPVQRRNRPRFAEAEAVEVERKALLRGVVDLVRDQQYGFARAAKDVGDLLVSGRHSRARIDHEKHEVGLAHGLLRLRGDGLRHR